MAITKLAKDGFGQIELNQVAWRRDGRIEAQCRLDKTEFPVDGSAVAENGMLFAVDRSTRLLNKATAALAAYCPIAINYSTEHMYDERKIGLKNFFLSNKGEQMLPRLGYPSVQDKLTTNTVCYDTDDFEDLDAVADALEDGDVVYAGIATDGSGYWQLFDSAPAAGPVARVVEVCDMPDGQPAVMLHIIKA